MSVDDGCDCNRRDGDAPNDFADRGAPSCRESRRRYVGPNVYIDYDGRNDVNGGISDLQKCQCLRPVIRILKLGNNTEKYSMAGCWAKLD